MDNEALKTANDYKKLEEQHFNGGYFSEAVKADTEKAMQLNETEKNAFFTDTFKKTRELAREIQQDPAFKVESSREDGSVSGTIDLGGDIGVIGIEINELNPEDTGDNTATSGVLVYSESFDPTPRKEMEWQYAGQSDINGEQVQVTKDIDPQNWQEPVWAHTDGTFNHEDENLDETIPRLLDMRETLEVAREQLAA